MKVPIYKENDILKAIQEEGLSSNAYGYKTPFCIFIYTDAMENNKIWDKYPTPLYGLEQADWNRNTLDTVKYFMIDKGPSFVNQVDPDFEEFQKQVKQFYK